MSTRPKRSKASSRSRSTSASFDTSQITPMRFAADRLDLADGFGEPRFVDVGEDDIGAAAGEFVGDARGRSRWRRP